MTVTQQAIMQAINESQSEHDNITMIYGITCYPIRQIGRGMYVERTLDGAYMIQGALAVRMARKLVEQGLLKVKRESNTLSNYLLYVIPV